MKSMGIVLFLAFAAFGQAAQAPQPSQAASTAAAANPASLDATQLQALIKQQFGATFNLSPKVATPVLVADFDGDGVEDVAIVANSKDPIPDSYEFKYDLSDPYNAYFGMGNPRFTAGFQADPERSHDLLIIFGNGKEAWHAATPKAKFVLINVPFDSVEVGRMLVSKKKPPVFIIKAVEAKIMDSAIWWDAKKKRWKWEPGGAPQ